jgi:hypothetical protein
MATTKVSQLAAKTSPSGSEELLINDGGTSKKITIANLPDTNTTYSVGDGGLTEINFTSADNTKLDGIEANATADQSNAEIKTAYEANSDTNAFTDADHSKLDGIEASATADQTDAEIRAAVEAATDSNVFTDADHSKLNAIEASADVTDATNVAAAGALMDSEVTNLAQVKAFDSSNYATAAQGTTADAALPKAGGTMTGTLAMAHASISGNVTTADNTLIQLGAGNDLILTHNGSNSQIKNLTGNLEILSDGLINMQDAGANETFAIFNDNGAVVLYHDNSAKIATTATGISVTGTAVATTNTDTSNTGSVTLDFAANQNFVLTLTGNTTLANPSTEQVGQSGFITFIQDGTGGRTVALGTDYETAGGAGLTLTSTASATDIVPYVVVASGRILLGTPQLAFA